MSGFLYRLIDLETRLAVAAQPFLLLAIRLYWGSQFFLTGRGKLLHIERTAAFFQSLDIPLPLLNAYAAGTIECLGGALLVLGIGTRLAAIPLIVTMLVAYATAHRPELLGLFTNPDAFVSAPPFLFLLASTLALVFGPGWLSLDAWLGHACRQGCSNRDEILQPAAPPQPETAHLPGVLS